MNKIKIEEITLINTNNYLEINEEKDIKINVKKDGRLVIVGKCNYNLWIKLDKNITLEVNSLSKDNSVNINIELLHNSRVSYNYSVLSCNDSINKFNICHLEDGSTSILNNNGINKENAKLFFEINGVIPKNLKNITCNQSSKIINFACGNSKIIPNFIIDSNDIVANHSAYIGEIQDDELFYLASRGIKYENIKKLIYKAVLLGKMNLKEESDKFNKLINEWW